MQIRYLGLQTYQHVLSIMENEHAAHVANPKKDGVILVTQHFPVVTMGKQDNNADLLLSPQNLKSLGVDYIQIDRGGSVTVHEPGQIVIYPIFHLSRQKQTVRSYVCLLEAAMIETAAQYGVCVTRDPINPGVWVKENKIGAVGIRVANKVTKHGIAFNVNNTLETFSHIVPCGLKGRGVTSLEKEMRKNQNGENKNNKMIDYSQVEKTLAEKIREKLG